MKLGLGIDTGGTYTDAVIYDFESRQVLAKAKALTTKENLADGIIQSLSRLPNDMLADVELVSLSTTLATNACVEGKGARGKLVLIGYDAQLLSELRSRYGLPDVKEIILVSGGHGQQGQVLAQPDWDDMEEQVRKTDAHTDAYGVVEYWGVRNPEFEQEAKQKIRQWTGKPVVCAHELSNEINSLRRASTTLLNAGLIKLIDQLLDAVKEGMARMGISAPIMIVRGDGTMMSESFARERPVETLLSGPAASVVGGMKLTGCQDALILDIGGTTSDLAMIRGGLTVLSEEGVDVGSWRTGTKAIKIRTIGLGGDSIITFDKNDNIQIGPRKATPLSWLAQHRPEIKQELKRIRDNCKWHTVSLGEFFYLVSEPSQDHNLNHEEICIIEALKDGPKSAEELASQVQCSIFLLRTENLERLGIIARGALTPSDLMHITGDYPAWDLESARLGAEIMANRLKISVEDLISKVYTGIIHKLYDLIVEFLLSGHMGPGRQSFSKDAQKLTNISFENPYDNIRIQISTSLPIIGIGAPAHIFLSQVAASLGTTALVTEHAGVANAIGAITGSIVGEETVLIKPRYDSTGITGYGCHASAAYFETQDYDEALEWARNIAAEYAEKQAAAMGAVNITVDIYEGSNTFEDSGVQLLMETVITAKAIGNQAIFSMAAK
ncbi:MAG TPA: hydantoinase/oxoprolinase family protein [Clostridiales bacterium]|nr:hydantoinase/oxoprolinase family protein [Clostridiales bacterium]